MRVVVANLHTGGNRHRAETVDALRNLLPPTRWVVLACEAHGFHDRLASLGTLSASEHRDRSRGECVVVTSRDLEVVSARTFKVCGPGAGAVQPARWATEVRAVDDQRRRWYFLSWHGHANVQNRVTGRPRRSLGAREYALGMGELARRVEVAQEAGYTAVVGGDANWVDRRPAWKWSPRVVFEDLGLAVRSHRVDYLATDATRLVLTEPLQIIPPPPGCDHSWLVADVAMKGAPVPVPIPDPYERVTFRGKTVDRMTQAALQVAESRLGYELTIVQGSYNAGGVSASAGTHDGGGVVDLAPYDYARKVRVLRDLGFAAWYRPASSSWNPHIHAVLAGNLKLSASAAAQVVEYLAGGDGLVGSSPDPNPYRPEPPVLFDYRAAVRDERLRGRIKGLRARVRTLRDRISYKGGKA